MAPQRPLPALFSRSVMKLAPATGAALLALAFFTPVIASALTHFNVPCSGAGGGASGLVAAINAANSSGGGTIGLVQGCTYTLSAANNTGTITMPGNPNPVTITWGIGLPVIKSKITIDGSGGDNQQQGQSDSSGATIAGNGKDFAIFEVDGPGGNLTLKDLTITKGFSAFAGGALLNAEGSVTLNQSRVIGNVGAFGGGGIASGVIDPNHLGPIGTLTLNSSQVDGNTALRGGGGGVLNHAGTLILNHSQVNNNTSGGGGGGIASGPGNGGAAGSSTLIVNLSQVSHNVSNGGAMAGAGGIANGGVATITHSQVDDNSAPGAPGGGILNHRTEPGEWKPGPERRHHRRRGWWNREHQHQLRPWDQRAQWRAYARPQPGERQHRVRTRRRNRRGRLQSRTTPRTTSLAWTRWSAPAGSQHRDGQLGRSRWRDLRVRRHPSDACQEPHPRQHARQLQPSWSRSGLRRLTNP